MPSPSEEVAADWLRYENDPVYHATVFTKAIEMHSRQCLCERGISGKDAWLAQAMQDLRRIHP